MGRKWIPLHPKKVKTINNIAPSALGEICVEMFISKTADAALHAEHHRKWPSFKVKGGSDKVDKSLSTSSNSLHPPDGSNLQRSNSSTSVATVAATPIAAPLDASSRRSSQVNIETPPPSTKKDSSKRVSVVGEAASAAASAQSGPAPEISGVSPKECTVAGGVRVIVKGSKLGTNTDDIATVRFGDNDALSVEWISSSKVAVVTPPRNKAGKVPVTIILRDGRNGGGSNFTYREDPNADHSVSNGHAKESSSLSAAAAAGGGFETPSYPATTADENYDAMSRPRLIAEIQKLKEENIKIMDTNAAMKEYIDALIIKMLEMDVDALEKR
ncbi:hypothetical protein, variant [Capsaspora owczarzaki ATCC 30864]|nr:hypothetical protein, variant [Capsaspora owczarzaki ATCC 30864]